MIKKKYARKIFSYHFITSQKCYYGLTSQLTLIYSKSTIETIEKGDMFKVNKNVVSLLLTMNIFYTFF